MRSKCSRKLTVVSAVLLVALCSQPLWAQGGRELFQRALLQERVEGNLEEAIRLYQRVVQESSQNRVLVAQALIRIGELFEKLGNPDARATYELVAWDYADQRQPAVAARARLALLDAMVAGETSQPPSRDPSYRFVYSDEAGTQLQDFSFAPDGDRFVFAAPKRTEPDKGNSELYVSDPSGNGPRPLVEDWGPWHPKAARWSPDGQYIAYWATPILDSPRPDPVAGRRGSGVFVVGVDGGIPRQIGPDIRGAIEDLVWSLDSGRLTVLVATIRGGAPAGLHTLDLEGHADPVIPMSVPFATTRLGGYSRNGRWLAFQATADLFGRPELWVMPAAGGRARRVSESSDLLAVTTSNAPFWLHHPTWAADGRALYFISDRSGSANVWKVGIDSRTGERRGEAEQVTFFKDATILHPNVLADGRMAFVLHRSRSVIHVADAVANYAARPLARGRAPQLSPDGQTIYYLGQGPGQEGIHSIPREGGTSRRLSRSQPGADENGGGGVKVSPDGYSLAYLIREGSEIGLFTVPTGGESRPRRLITLAEAIDELPEVQWSPDGSRLAFGILNGLHVIPATGGGAREIAHLRLIENTVRWSPDGQYLAGLGAAVPGGRVDVFVVPASGGEPRWLTHSTDDDYKEGLEWHPDGERLTYMNYGPDGIWEANLDGRPAALLIDQPDLWDYVGRWSPDGHQFFFVSARRGVDSPLGLYVYDDRSRATTVVWPADEGSAGLPSFSRDGTTATWSVTTGVGQLWLMENYR